MCKIYAQHIVLKKTIAIYKLYSILINNVVTFQKFYFCTFQTHQPWWQSTQQRSQLKKDRQSLLHVLPKEVLIQHIHGIRLDLPTRLPQDLCLKLSMLQRLLSEPTHVKPQTTMDQTKPWSLLTYNVCCCCTFL